jgi:lipid A 3-O-deacylase
MEWFLTGFTLGILLTIWGLAGRLRSGSAYKAGMPGARPGCGDADVLELRRRTGYRAAIPFVAPFLRGLMRQSCFAFAGIAVALAAAFPGAARADGGFLDELRLGVYEHDASVLGHQKEHGEDIGGELLFTSPSLLEIIWSPRPVIGVLVNTAGQTDQAYGGLTWTWDFLHNVLMNGDGFYVEGTLGGGVNNGKINVTDPYESQHEKSLGSNVLFREDIDLGYRFTPRWSVAISYNHISDADLAFRNEGLNDIGVRVGMKF